ncbi:hypothetical protein [Planomonospora sp. ID82291]|nr:hypothetical protein [Planomonospora sp. ID82291]MBG0815007.1 hypothetical protein [Planomonospora sp. ID82291]
MHNHEPADHHYPFCHLTSDPEPEVVYRDERVFAMICPPGGRGTRDIC